MTGPKNVRDTPDPLKTLFVQEKLPEAQTRNSGCQHLQPNISRRISPAKHLPQNITSRMSGAELGLPFSYDEATGLLAAQLDGASAESPATLLVEW